MISFNTYTQCSASRYLTSSSLGGLFGGVKVTPLMFSVCQFPWCKCTSPGRLQAPRVELGQLTVVRRGTRPAHSTAML